jgi:hypothetical protein
VGEELEDENHGVSAFSRESPECPIFVSSFSLVLFIGNSEVT